MRHLRKCGAPARASSSQLGGAVSGRKRGWKAIEMSDSMFSSLLGMLDKPSLGGIASALGESEQSVSHGMESSIAAVLGGLAAKSEDPNSLRRILDLVPGTLRGVTGSQMASSAANPD